MKKKQKRRGFKRPKKMSASEEAQWRRLEHEATRGWAKGALDKYTTGVRSVVSGGLPTLGKRR